VVDTGGTSWAPVSAGVLFSLMPPMPPMDEQAVASKTMAVMEATFNVFLK
jgi:hypothetical protein